MEFNNKFFEDLSVSPPVTALVVGVANRIADRARTTAPRKTNDYANGIVVAVKRQKRSVALVIATDPKSMLIEAKTGNLARALRAEKHRG